MPDNRIIFHFNKGFLTDPSIPMWVVKHRGRTEYVDHLRSEVGFDTKETPDNSHTKGSIMFRGHLQIIEADGKKTALVLDNETDIV